MIRVAGTIRVPLDEHPEPVLTRLRKLATVPVLETKRYRGELLRVETKRELSRFEGSDLVLPRGLANGSREITKEVAWTDETVRAPHSFTSRIPYRPQQIAIADVVATKVQGLALAATGAGKTGAACATIAKVEQRTLVLVPTVALAQQWRQEIGRFLGIDAAVCSGGEWTDAPIVVATPTTAASHPEKLSSFGLLIVDEVQGFATELRVALIEQIPARYRLGLTATLPRDHRGHVLRAVFGPVLYRFGVADGIASGALVSPTYEQVRTGFCAAYDGPDDWPKLLESLINNTARNGQIVDLVAAECAGMCTLVLSTRLAHLDVLREMFAARGLRVAILSGASAAAERESVLASARAGELDVLLGSTVADEGIDIPGLGALVLAFPSKAEGRLMQRIGRVVRAVPGKGRPRVFDLVDDVGPLRRQAELRRQAFAQAFAKAVAA